MFGSCLGQLVVVLEDDTIGGVPFESDEFLVVEGGVHCGYQRCGIELFWLPACAQLQIAAGGVPVFVVLLVSSWVADYAVLANWINLLGHQFEGFLTILDKLNVGQSQYQIIFHRFLTNWSKQYFYVR